MVEEVFSSSLFRFWRWSPFFYFLVIRPQQKRQKELETMRNNLKNGDRVVTEGGIYGTVAGINEKENTLHLLVAPSVKIEFSRNAIIGLRDQPNK